MWRHRTVMVACILGGLAIDGPAQATAYADGLMTVRLAWRSPVGDAAQASIPCSTTFSDVFCAVANGSNETFRYSIVKSTSYSNTTGPAASDGIVAAAANDVTDPIGGTFAVGSTMTYQFYSSATNGAGPNSLSLGRADLYGYPLLYIDQPHLQVTTPNSNKYSQLDLSYNFDWGDFAKDFEIFSPPYPSDQNSADLNAVPGEFSDAVTVGYFSICVNDVLTVNASCVQKVGDVVHKGQLFGFAGGGGGRVIDFNDLHSPGGSMLETIDLQPWVNSQTIYISAVHIGVASYATTVAIPEPNTWALLLAGFAGLGAVLRRRAAQFHLGH